MLDTLDTSPGTAPGTAAHALALPVAPATSDHVSDHVVLVDPRGRPTGTLPKADVHHTDTPLHLAFSCHVIRPDGKVLITRRSLDKRTWPGVWTNACCGHPRMGETLRDAIRRHVASELGCGLGRASVALGDFAYRAEMDNGIVEHELCPVVIAEIEGPIRLNPAEADDAKWVDWADLQDRARTDPASLSPWVVAQLGQLPGSVDALRELLDTGVALDAVVLDAAIEIDAGAELVTTAAAFGASFSEPIEPLEALLAAFLAERQDELGGVDPTAAALGDAVCQLVSGGGKRLRPAFVYWGWRAACGERGALDAYEPAAHTLGAAIELLHTFALLHDDVMDQADTRRGLPTARVSFAESHRQRRGSGDPGLFGTSAATLAGDLAFVWADLMIDAMEIGPERLRSVRRVYGQLRTEVIAGQYLDLCAGSCALDGTSTVGEQAALTVARLKSARYTVTRPLELGAALAGRTGDACELRALRVYGDAVGLAFQMRDDVLDMFGDARATGKPALGDLREGKRTVLLERALRLAGPRDAAFLRAAVGSPELSDDDALRCRDIVAASGALASVESLIATQHRLAVAALAEIQDPARDALRCLAQLAVERSA